jgi:hypothetical protein
MTTPQPSEGERLEKLLKGEAKSLLKAVKAGDTEALHRVAAYFDAPETVTLQQVQLVVARDHGMDSWRKLKARAHTPRQTTGLDQPLEEILSAAFAAATKNRHEHFTVEHALLALVEMPEVHDLLSILGCDVESLCEELVTFIDTHVPTLGRESEQPIPPSPGFIRVMQRAAFHVQFAGNDVSATNVLVSVLSEKDATAVEALERHNINRMRVVDLVKSRR